MKTSREGQAVVELVMGIGVLGVMLGGFVTLSQLVFSRFRLLEQVRLGSQLMATGRFSDAALISEMQRWNSSSQVQLRLFKETPSSVFFHLKKIKADVPQSGSVLSESIVIYQPEGAL